MKIDVNFKSIVVIGGFNPNILSPEFLFTKCDFESSHESKGRTSSVVSELVFGNTQFLMELNKFQIMTTNIDGFADFFPLDIAIKYLQVLEYTPLQILGVNFNYRISEVITTPMREAFMNPCELGALLNVDPSSILLGLRKQDGVGLVVEELTVTHQIDSDIKNSLSLKLDEQSIGVNNNFEINRLDESHSRLTLFADKYQGLVEIDQNVLQTIMGIGA